ncbi:unnamed protein product, partial [Pelagomonas calceolata]
VRPRATRAGGATSAAAVLSTARRRMLQLWRPLSAKGQAWVVGCGADKSQCPAYGCVAAMATVVVKSPPRRHKLLSLSSL